MFWTEYNDTLKKKKKKSESLYSVQNIYSRVDLQWCKFLRIIKFYYLLKTFNDRCDIFLMLAPMLATR